jgi:hypothetical protein
MSHSRIVRSAQLAAKKRLSGENVILTGPGRSSCPPGCVVSACQIRACWVACWRWTSEAAEPHVDAGDQGVEPERLAQRLQGGQVPQPDLRAGEPGRADPAGDGGHDRAAGRRDAGNRAG